MVVPVRDLGNKFVFFSSNMYLQQDLQLPTVFLSNCTGMDILPGYSPNNYDEVKERRVSHKSQGSRDSSMSSTKSSVIYHERMEHNNEDVDIDNNSHALLYEMTQEKAFQVSKVADTNNSTVTTTLQHISSEHPNITSTHVDDAVINIQLQYDLNAPMEPDLWDGSFHPISLHSSIKHIALDSKNIRDSLNFMAKSNKSIQPNLMIWKISRVLEKQFGISSLWYINLNGTLS